MRLRRPLLLFWTATLLGACSNAGPTRPHVILISIDTLRADHVGAYGYARPTTPAIDRLAAQSVRFDNAISPASWTLPAHMSLMTSLRPSVHGVDQDRALDLSATTLAEVLAQAGYRTGAFISWVYLSEVYGLQQGFDEFFTLIDRKQVDLASGAGAQRASQIADAVVDWLSGKRDRPNFLFVHFFDPHMDYDPPAQYRTMFGATQSSDGRYAALKPYMLGLNANPPQLASERLAEITALYDAEIRATDDALDRILQALDRELGLDNCLIVLLSDHGEEFLDHGSMEGHGWTLYEEIVRVPLLLRLPGPSPTARVVQSPVSLLDLAPTICDLLEVAVPASFEGSSLRPLCEGKAERKSAPYAYSEHDRFNVHKRSLRGERYKLIFTADSGRNSAGVPIVPGYELYDLHQDPQEQRNLYRAGEPQSEALRLLLEQLAKAPAAAPLQNPAAELTPEQLELLKSLGYVQ
jgi:arylsulfatase A-like enzyme